MANTIREPKKSVILRYPDIVVGVSRWVFVFSQFITSFEAASTACLQEAGSQSRTSKEINAVGCEKPIWSPFRWRQIFMVKLWTVCKCLSQSIYLLSRFWEYVGSKPRILIANAIENLIKMWHISYKSNMEKFEIYLILVCTIAGQPLWFLLLMVLDKVKKDQKRDYSR